MKKNAIILGAGMLLAAGILAGCGTASTGKGSQGGSQGDGAGTLVLDEEQGYLAQAVLSLDLLGGLGGTETLHTGVLKAPDLAPGGEIASESQAVPTEKDLLAEEILLSAHSLGSLLSFSPGSVETLPSDREGYESLQVVTINDIDGTSETYSLYLNETVREIEEEHDEWEKTTRIEGIAIRDGVEYAVRGERSEEKERDEWETELELRIALDAKNYVEIEQSLEDNENEYEYTLVENGREVVQAGRRANLLRMFEDKPIYYDNWDIDIFYTEKFWDVTDVKDFTWTENGPVRATLHIERPYSHSTVKQDIHFYADSRRIDFDTTVDWHEHQHLLKVFFPANVHTDYATFDVQFGSLKRKVHKNTSWDKARFEYGGQKWMDFSEGHYGVALLNDCKYGHSVHDGVLSLTLIKSGIEPNPNADVEVHHFTYALYPHGGTWKEAGTVQEAYKLNQPAYTVAAGAPGTSRSFAGVDQDNVILETVKQAEDGNGTIFRLYECQNARTNTVLRVPETVTKAYSTNLLEEIEEELPVENGKIAFTIKPYEIKTILVR